MTEKAISRVLGGFVDEDTLQADLARYRELTLELGATASTVIPASDVVVDGRVRLKCLVPHCLWAGETPNCPPHASDLDLVRRAFSRYSWAEQFPPEESDQQPRTPESDRCKTVGQHGEERWCLLSIVCPAGTRRAPQFEKVPQSGSGSEHQHRPAMVGRRGDHQRACDQRQHSERLVSRGPDKGHHHSEKRWKDEPVEGRERFVVPSVRYPAL